MRKREKAEKAFLEVLRREQLAGSAGMYAFDLLRAANEVPTDPSRAHRLGGVLLKLARLDPKPYKPNYSFQLYPTLSRMEQQGLVDADWELEPSTPGGHRRRLYRLSDEVANSQST